MDDLMVNSSGIDGKFAYKFAPVQNLVEKLCSSLGQKILIFYTAMIWIVLGAEQSESRTSEFYINLYKLSYINMNAVSDVACMQTRVLPSKCAHPPWVSLSNRTRRISTRATQR